MDVVINSESDGVLVTQRLIKGYASFYHNVLACLGYSTQYPPVADWLRLYHGLTGTFVVVTPVHWQATHNDALIMACGHQLPISEAQSRAAFALFSAFTAEIGLTSVYHDASTWLMQCDEMPLLHAQSPYLLVHTSLAEPLRALDASMVWQRWLTEVQMLFSGFAQAQDVAINGVWAWGSGRLAEDKSTVPIRVANQRTFELATLVSSSVSDVGGNSELLLFDALDTEALSTLQRQLSSQVVNWYWNNQAYQTHPQHWFSKIFSFKRARHAN